jgi:acyl dehydratase
MPKRSLEDFFVGEQAEFARTFTEIDVAQFVGMTWDVNPYHTDAEFCRTHRVGARIVPGLLVGSMLTHISCAQSAYRRALSAIYCRRYCQKLF